MDRGYSSWGHKELDTNEQLTTFLISKNSGRFDRKYRVNKYGSCHLWGWQYRKGESHAHHKAVSQVARLPRKDILLLSVQYPFSLLCKPYYSFPLRSHLFLLMWKCLITPSFIHPPSPPRQGVTQTWPLRIFAGNVLFPHWCCLL